MRLLTWNIMHGGGGERLPRIGLSLIGSGADVIAITEFRTARGGALRAVLADHGWVHQAQSDEDPGKSANTVFLASRRPILRAEQNHGLPPPLRRRLLTVELPGAVITAAHVPDAARGDRAAMVRKAAVWRAIIDGARTLRDRPHVVLGDLNTGRHRLDEPGATFTGTALLGRLVSLGYVDAWRAVHGAGARQGSWTSHTGTAYRLDHALVSGRLAGAVTGAWYDQNALKNRLSDHAPLVVDLCGTAEPARRRQGGWAGKG